MENENKALPRVYSHEEINPLVKKLDHVCDRLELIEVIAALFSSWRGADSGEPEFSAKVITYIGELIQVDCIESKYFLKNELRKALVDCTSRKGGQQ